MIVSIIVAHGKNGEIGCGNQLLWHLPEELKNFKRFTNGHHIIMGRKTFDSIGRALPNRTTIVVTRNKDWHCDGVLPAASLEEAVELAAKSGDDEVFICGGGQIYADVLKKDLANRLYLTQVDWEGEADTYLPCIDMSKWNSTHKQICAVSDTNSCEWMLEVFEKSE